MSSSEPSRSIPFKSKKLAVKSTSKHELTNPTSLLASKTPEKPPSELPRRPRNRNVALSLKEVRRAAKDLSQQPTQQIKFARKQILSWPAESPLPKPRNAGDGSNKLPQTYEMLSEFFDGLDSAIRLSKLKRSMPTFANISPKIESLTDRRFSHNHLAQLKYILPEAIEIKRVLVFDERTCCMKPDLHVTLNVDAVEYAESFKSESKNIALRKVFRARLADFYKVHPEGDEVPEEMLPEPFNSSKGSLHSESLNATSLSAHNESSGSKPASQHLVLSKSGVEGGHKCKEMQAQESPMSLTVDTSTDTAAEKLPMAASRLTHSFRRHFYGKVASTETVKSEKNSSKHSIQASVLQLPEVSLNNEEASSMSTFSPIKFLSKPTSNEKCLSHCTTPAKFFSSCPPATPIKEMEPMESKDTSPKKCATVQSTPAKLASTPARLMTATPTLQPPKRCYMSPDNVSTSSPNKLVRRPPLTRSLNFDSPAKIKKVDAIVVTETVEHENEMESASAGDDILDILPESLLQSIREQEKKAMKEKDPAISQAKRRRQMIACLPKFFNVIHFLFQSIRRSVITKDELMFKIIAGHTDIVDRREVEEQLNLLLELVPDWISEKMASSGDMLVCINKMSSAESIRARLGEAKDEGDS